MTERLIICDGVVFLDIGVGYLIAVAKLADFLSMTPEQRAESIRLVKVTSGKMVQ